MTTNNTFNSEEQDFHRFYLERMLSLSSLSAEEEYFIITVVSAYHHCRHLDHNLDLEL